VIISIIIPVLNEEKHIHRFLCSLRQYKDRGHEIILVDGGSIDNTINIAQPMVTHCLASEAGRAKQMNTGAKTARGDVLLFLHADTFLPDNADFFIQESLSDRKCNKKRNKKWGRFNVQFTSNHLAFRMIESMMNLRSRITGIATGDQAIFMTKDTFNRVGCYPEIKLMEDICMSKSLLKHSRPACLKQKVITSSRRWETHGILRTIFFMWSLRLRFFLGANPEDLAAEYQR